MKSKLAAALAVLYLIFPMSFVFLLLIFTPIMYLSDVSAVRNSGFAGPQTAMSMIGICGLFIGISMLVPALRRMYRALPWMYSFIVIFFVNLIILSVGLMILNKGYEVSNTTRHMIFTILMVIFIIGGRLCMSIYFWKKPVDSVEMR